MVEAHSNSLHRSGSIVCSPLTKPAKMRIDRNIRLESEIVVESEILEESDGVILINFKIWSYLVVYEKSADHDELSGACS